MNRLARLLWFPAGAASVATTMYLAHLWLESGAASLAVVPEPPSAEESEESSDDMASPDEAQEDGSADEEKREEQEGENEEAEEAEEEAVQDEKPAPIPEPKPEAKTPQEPQPQAKESVDVMDGVENLYTFIRHQVGEINSKHESWRRVDRGLFDSWSLSKTVSGLKEALARYEKLERELARANAGGAGADAQKEGSSSAESPAA